MAKHWMVEQFVQIGGENGMCVPIRGIAPGRNRRRAEKNAADAIKYALLIMSRSTGKVCETQTKGPAIVLYEM